MKNETKSKEQIIDESVIMTVREFAGLRDRSTVNAIALVAAEIALDLAGFSGDDPQDTPRSLSVPPRSPRKNGEFGPTETRRTE